MPSFLLLESGDSARSSDWIATRSRMLKSPGTFFTTGTPERGAGGGGSIESPAALLGLLI
jgi:hypothetical protein